MRKPWCTSNSPACALLNVPRIPKPAHLRRASILRSKILAEVGFTSTEHFNYQSFEGSRTSDNDTFQATYNASVTGFNGQDILVADTDLKENECREIVIQYQFDSLDGKCQLIYISPDLEEQVLSESSSGSVAVQLQVGANYIGITGTDYSGTIQITVE